MTDFANLPADITPAQLFSAVTEALANEPAPANAAPDKLVVHIDGESWSAGFVGGKLAIDQGASAGAPLQLSISLDDLRAFVAGDIRDAVKAKTGGRGTIDAKQIGKVFKLSNKTEQVKQFSGDLQLKIENGPKTHKLTLTFGGGAPNTAAPTTTISLSLADFLALIGGELNPMAAFMGGQIKIEGDYNLAMGLSALAM